MSFANPNVQAVSANPLVTGTNSSLVPAIQQGWSRQPLWSYADVSRTFDSQGMIDVFPIPTKPPLPKARVPGGRSTVHVPAITSIAVQQTSYDDTLAIDFHAYNTQKGLQSVYDAIIAQFYDCADRHLRAEFSRHLALNNTLTSYDNVAFFSASHPVNPMNPTIKARATGSTTYSNSLGLGAFSANNLMTAINTIVKNAVYEDGEPISPRNFVLFVTPANMIKAFHWTQSSMLNFGSGAAVADVASNVNPFATLQSALGVSIRVVVMPEYPTNDTDWFIAIDAPFLVSIGQWYTPAQLTTPDSFPRFRDNVNSYQVTAQLGIAKTLPNMLFKCY